MFFQTSVAGIFRRVYRFIFAVALLMTTFTSAPSRADEETEKPWSAQWIAPAEIAAREPAPPDPVWPPKRKRNDPLANTWICFRKQIHLDAKPRSAVARIAVDSKYWLWINGKLVVFEGGLKRGPNRTDTYYDTIDLAPHLSNGNNTIALLVWYFGKEGFSHISSGKPGLIFDATIDGRPLLSDDSWKTMIHPAYGETGDPHPNGRLAESNLHFDAQRDIPGWTNANFDDSAWQNAKAMGTAPVSPWNALVARPIPQWKDSGLRDYTNASQLPRQTDGKVIVAKLSYDAQVTPYLKVDAPAGLTIDMRTDSYDVGGEKSVRAEYITRTGVQEYESLGWMSGHEIHYTIPAGVKVLSLKYRETGYDTEFTGSFTCDDPYFNSLWSKAHRTLYVNMRDTFFDCPDRERAQWWGDAVIDLGEMFYTFDRKSDLLARKALIELANWQKPDGVLFSPSPAGNWDKELPPQMLATIGWYGAWLYYHNTGDAETIRYIYPHIRKYLGLWKLNADGLVVHRAGDWDWEDWGENIDVPLLDNTWYVLALKASIEMAKLTGNDADVAGYQQQIESIERNYNKTFWKGNEYRSPAYTGDTDDRGNAMAVLAGFVQPDQRDAVKAVLRKHHNASPYMEKYVLEAMYQLRDAAGACERMKTRYKSMVDRSITTLSELFDGGGTYNHAWSGGPLTMLHQFAAGLEPTGVAYESFQVMPQMGTLKSIETVTPTPKGTLRLSMQRTEKTFDLELTAPPFTHGIVGIPGNPKRVTINGQEQQPTDRDENYAKFKAEPGNSRFHAEY